MPLLASLFFGFVPMFLFAGFVYWLDRYEKEPRLLLGAVFFWGAVIASGAAFLLNTFFGAGVYLFTESDAITNLTTGSIIAPVVEEILKGFAVLLVFLVFRSEFDSVLDGIIYAAVVALGFAATENTYYIYQLGYLEDGWTGLFSLAFIRVILVGWQHPFYTAFFGIGLAWARLSSGKLRKILFPLLGLTLAIFTHSFHNTISELFDGNTSWLIGTLFDWSGWLLMFIFTLWMIRRERAYLVRHLAEEVQMGILSPDQYKTACSALLQNNARLLSLARRRYYATNRFYQLCGELSHKKEQLNIVGEENGNTAIVQRLRAELSALSNMAVHW
jgi:RsiW-degrading membrane proteinase PrsW (M82 family)